MIGLVDIDLQSSTSTNLCPPNLEIMKLATYYKIEENVFCRLISLNETELTSYEKIYIFSEAGAPPQLPEAFRRASNVILGGTAFTNGIYVPFKNEIIDYTIPKALIYKQFLSEKHDAGIKSKIIEHILDDSYYRMYAGNNRLPIPPVLPRKRMFIYDKDFFVPDWTQIIDTIVERNPSSIYPIHPVYCKNLNQYFKLREYPKIAKDAQIILDFNIPLQDTQYLMKKYKNKFLADIKKTSNVFITLGGTFDTAFQYEKDFIYKLNLLYVYWSNLIPIKIKYIQPATGHINPLENLSKLIEFWANGDTNKTKSISERIYKDKKVSEIRPERAERNALIDKYPSTKILFLQNRETIEKGGFWRHGY